MAARGLKVNHDGTVQAGAHYDAANFVNLVTTDFTICGWMTIRGSVSGTPTPQQAGNDIFCAAGGGDFASNGGVVFYATDSRDASPWTMRGRVATGGADADCAITPDFATDEVYFVAISCVASGGNLCTPTAYWGIDEAVSLSNSTTTGVNMSGKDPDAILIAYATGLNYASNIEVTNVKVWVGDALDGTELLAEMKSEAAVITANLYAHWKLATHTDLTDYSGNGRTLTAIGSVSTGTMDPVDIQGGGGGGSSGARGFQNLTDPRMAGRLQL